MGSSRRSGFITTTSAGGAAAGGAFDFGLQLETSAVTAMRRGDETVSLSMEGREGGMRSAFCQSANAPVPPHGGGTCTPARPAEPGAPGFSLADAPSIRRTAADRIRKPLISTGL